MADLTLHTPISGYINAAEPPKDTAHGKRQNVHVIITKSLRPEHIGQTMPAVLWRENAEADLPSIKPTKAEQAAGTKAVFDFTVKATGTWNNIVTVQRAEA